MNKILTFICILVAHFAQAQTYTSWIVGNNTDITTTQQAGLLLAGGGTDNDDAMRWFLQKAQGGDVVVLRASGGDGYNTYLFSELGITVHSVETLLIPSRSAAENAYIAQQIRNAEALFITGGDQYQYYQYWKDSPVEEAINYLINTKKTVVGGTSAGMMILGKAYYAPQNSGVTTSEALLNPYHTNMTLLGKNDFIDAPYMRNTLCDTHYDQRTRAGRHVAFLARMETDWEINAQGIACNEHTAVAVDEAGKARVFGSATNDYAYFMQTNGVYPNSAPEKCEAGKSLDWQRNDKAVKVYKVLGTTTGTNYFQLTDWRTGAGGSWENWFVKNNVLNKVPTSELPALPTGELQLKQNGQNLLTNTDFSMGFAVLSQTSTPLTFTLINSGEKALQAQLPTSNSTNFVINGAFTSLSIPAESSTTFTITYQATEAKAHEGILSIASEDADENPFTLRLLGVALATATEDKWWKGKTSLYPNPTTEDMRLTLYKTENKTIQLTFRDMQGKTIYTAQTKESVTLPTAKLPKGVYYLHLQTEKKQTTLTIIKQ